LWREDVPFGRDMMAGEEKVPRTAGALLVVACAGALLKIARIGLELCALIEEANEDDADATEGDTAEGDTANDPCCDAARAVVNPLGGLPVAKAPANLLTPELGRLAAYRLA